ncbi:ORC ubiquitin ligase 1 [Lampris incognitus]|uniref:ORC ubiquitin ligase 1 n=1 Tax=Lampris incognitus TaxID=2546036 RepID=UPI0024B5EE9A|nr:ORC ubiquitin ligase 1 [Lampris incognitus]
MAHNFQTSTLSLTLPICCQICLGKVRQPVICANYHVFCSPCIEMWLKKASQCPTCRVPITAANPCREIIGATNEGEHRESHPVRKRLRKARGELLLKEYEDEIEGLLSENEGLRTKNQSLESQLKTALDPSSIAVSRTGDNQVDPFILEEWINKLQAATDVCSKVKQDNEKLKEANKALRSQNVDLVQENMHLKAEVASRSPQKFGRFTVAALEAKIQQYERDVDHLKRALERSDQYIEDLESRVSESNRRPLDHQDVFGDSKPKPKALTEPQRIDMMRRSLSDSERKSICSNPEAEFQMLPASHSSVFTTSTGGVDHRELGESLGRQQEDQDLENGSSQILPSTPSSAFSSLTLRSPGIREKKVAFRSTAYLRRLYFEECPSLGKSDDTSCTTENQFSNLSKLPEDQPPSAELEPSKSVLWGAWQRSSSSSPSCSGSRKERSSPDKGATPNNVLNNEPENFQMSSEASMDAAYLDKISELDSMMLEGESSSSRGSVRSLTFSPPTDLDATLIPEPKTRSYILTSCVDKGLTVSKGHSSLSNGQQNLSPCDIIGGTLLNTEAPADSTEEEAALLTSEGDVYVLGCAESETPQTDELSFDLLFDPLEENKADLSGLLCPENFHDVNASSSSAGSSCKPGSTTRDRQTLTINQPSKRKSHSPCNINSPTKLSKLK